jgi:HSP20 family protein
MQTQSQSMPIRAFRTDELVTIVAPMPGLAPDDIRVEVTGKGHVIVDGKLCADRDDLCGEIKSGDKEMLIDEWKVGPYHRDIALPTGVDGSAANVTFGNGVLVISLPVAKHTRPAAITLEPTSSGRGERLSRAEQPTG